MSKANILSCFSSSYREARQKFLAACKTRTLQVDSRRNPNAIGVKGEPLYTDIVRIGASDAKKALLLLSGTHGVEGYCGSGVQVALLNHGFLDNLPTDICVIIIHAMNPYGFSHDRRVTEDNVDLNRNFVDFTSPDLPGKDYGHIHEHILPNDWDGPAREEADRQLAHYIGVHGMKAFQAAVSSGQYLCPDGIFFGGNAPTWSNAMFRSVLSEYLVGKSVVGTIDFHTGLGPHGYGELIAIGSEAQKARAAEWYDDDVTDPEAGTSTSANLDGMVAHCIAETFTDTAMTFITLEFGTYEITKVLDALRGDNWLYQQERVDSALRASIKRDIREAFYPDTEEWKLSVWKRSYSVFQKAIEGLHL